MGSDFDVPAFAEGMLRLLDRCDEATAAAGGRVYLAKDARVEAAYFASMYPRLPEWRNVVGHFNRSGRLCLT